MRFSFVVARDPASGLPMVAIDSIIGYLRNEDNGWTLDQIADMFENLAEQIK